MPTPYPFQMEAMRFISSRNGNAIIGDEMGLGKTVEALGYLRCCPAIRPALILCPACVKYNWEREVGIWLRPGEVVKVIDGGFTSSAAKELAGASIVIVNYDILNDRTNKKGKIISRGWKSYLAASRFQQLVADECHALKNHEAGRTEAVMSLAARIPRKLFMSGTPIESRAMDVYPLLHMLEPDKWQSWRQFAHLYSVPEFDGRKLVYKKSKNMDQLHQVLSAHMLRRLKKEVLPQLPSATRCVVPVKLANMKEYKEVAAPLEHFKGRKLQGEEVTAALVAVGKARMASAKGKAPVVIEWLKEWFADGGGKFVLFGHHREPLEQVVKAFGSKCVLVNGDVSAKNREVVVRRFQEDPSVILFVGNIEAGGVGITLTAASNLGLLELHYIPTRNTQAIDRIVRIGQKSDSVNIYLFTAMGTIDERVMAINDEKEWTAKKIVDGGDLSESELLSLLLSGA